MITEMVSDYTFKNGYIEVVVKTICDTKKHRTYVKCFDVWKLSNEFDCLCAFSKKELKGEK